MNVYIPGYIPPVPDPRKDVQTLPKELMSSTPGMSGPMSIPTQNMSTPPVQTAPMSVPKAPVTPMVDPIGRNFTGVPQALTPIQQQTAKEIPPMTVERPTPMVPQVSQSIQDATEEDYQMASDYFDTINLTQEEADFIDNSVKQGNEFKDAMLYIASKRQNESTTSWEDMSQEAPEKKGFLNSLAELLRINEETGKLGEEADDSEVTRRVKPIINDLTSVGKFVLNLPADTVEFADIILDMAMNPWQTTQGILGILGATGQGLTQTVGAVAKGQSFKETGEQMAKNAEAAMQDKNAGPIKKFFAENVIENDAIMKAIAEDISSYFTEEGKFRKTIVENPTDVLTTIIPISKALSTIKVGGEASKASQYAQFMKSLQEAKSSVTFMKPAILEGRMASKLKNKLPRAGVDPRISVINKVGEMTGNPELAAKTFADLDNAEIGAIKNIGPTKVQEIITDLNAIDEAAIEGGGRGNIYNKLSTEVMEGVGKRSKESLEIEKVRKQIVKDSDVTFTKEEMQAIFDEEIGKDGIVRKTGDKGSEYSVAGEGAIKESEISKLDDLEREIFRTDKEIYSSSEIDTRIKNLQKNLYDKDGKPKNGSESVTKRTESIIARLNERFKEKMPPEYSEAKEKMSQILTDRKRILKELKEEDNTIALGRDIDMMDEAELGKLLEDSIAGNRMALFLRRLASNTTTGGDPQSLANVVKRFTGIDVENRALALRALAKATGKTQIANELGGLLVSNRSLTDKALAATGKILSPSGEKTIKELASRGSERKIPYEPKTVKYEKKVVEKPTQNKYVKTRTEVEEKVEPSKVDYERARGTIERPNVRNDVRTASNTLAGRSDRRGVIVTPRGEVKALPPAQPVWAQQMDGQYSDPHGYLKAIQRDIMNGDVKLKQVDNFGETTSTDELNYLLNDRNIQNKNDFYQTILDRHEIKNDVGFTKLLDDAYKNFNGDIGRYIMGDADYNAMNNPKQAHAVRAIFGDELGDDVLEGYRYMKENGYTEVVDKKGKRGTPNKAITKLIEAVNEYNSMHNKSGSATYDMTPDEAFNVVDDIVRAIQNKQKKFQTLSERYEVAPEISVSQVKEIMGKDFPVKIVDKLQTPEGRKAMGMYYQGAIEIAKNPVSTTGYHEAFHGWLEIYGPSKLREAAFKQIERTTGITSKIDIEEHLAEAFAMWKLSGRGVSGALKQFFQAVWEDIKSLIGKQDKVLDLFRNVGKKGRMNELSKNRMLQDLSYESPNGITTKVLDELQGRTNVSKQFIENLLRRDDVRQVEKDIFAEKLRNFGDKVDIGELSDQIRAELLPLKQKALFRGEEAQYEYRALSDEIRGDYEDYWENIYESPIKTEAGRKHFISYSPEKSMDLTPQNYFGHTRVEDMADGKTRRVIEVQSDLYQKGNIDKEMIPYTLTRDVENALYDLSNFNWKPDKIPAIIKKYGLDDRAKQIILEKLKTKSPSSIGAEGMNTMKKFAEEVGNIKGTDKRIAEVQKLKQYTDPTAHFRMVREEIATAAKDGRTKLQFPTGETAMKVEGLGGESSYWNIGTFGTNNRLTIEKLEVGKLVNNMNNDWIITDVLGDGKFKAVPKDRWEYKWGKNVDGKVWNDLSDTGKKYLSQFQEEFDISGKVDTQNPIYKFYENEMQKYLKRFGAQRVTDDKGVEWFEVPIKEEYGKRAVQAFQASNESMFTLQNIENELKEASKLGEKNGGIKGDARVIYMSPDEYIQSAYDVLKSKGRTGTMEQLINARKDKVAIYEKSARDGTKTTPPQLDYLNGRQDGFHRALVAKNLGEKEIPVIVIGEEKMVLNGKRPVQAFQSTPDITVGKGKVFYHGTSKENYDSILKNGWDTSKNKKGFAEDPHAMYVSTSTEANSDHSAGTYGKYILKVEPKGEVKMLDSNSRKWLETAGTSRNMKETQEWHKKLAKEGYDGIMEPNGEVIIFNPDKFKITSQSETYSRPTSSFFNKSAVIGEGTEGEVRDLGNFAVKKINNSSVDTEMIDKIKTLIKSPNKDYIEYYDIWEDAGNSYISMQKLTKDQLRQPFIDLGKVDSRGDWMEAIFNAAVNNEKFPIKYEKIKNNPFVKFLDYISRKYPNISDITPENMAVINGEYKLFDSW